MVRVRNQAKMKVIPERPQHLKQKKKIASFEDTTDDEDNYDYITLQPTLQEQDQAEAGVEEFHPLNLEGLEMELEHEGEQEEEQEGEQEQEPRTPEPRRPRR